MKKTNISDVMKAIRSIVDKYNRCHDNSIVQINANFEDTVIAGEKRKIIIESEINLK